MKIPLSLLAIVVSFGLNAQQLKKTYYDYNKTKVDEEYFVNAKGEKNGKYKEYTREGILGQEANYVNGQLDGVYIKYATYGGKAELASKETYKADLLNGPATYYGEVGLILRQGNYIDGKKDGAWTILTPYNNYELKPEEKGECKYTKTEIVYKEDKEVEGKETDGPHKFYYVPCNKIYAEYIVSGGKIDGEMKYYYPTGKISDIKKYDYSTGTKKKMYSKSYFPNGKLRELEDFSSGQRKYEEYTESGEPTNYMKGQMQIIRENNAKKSGDSCLINHDDIASARKFYDLGKDYSTVTNLDKLEEGNKAIELKNYKSALECFMKGQNKLNQAELTPYFDKKIKLLQPLAQKQTELENIIKSVDQKVQKYAATFVLKENGSVSFPKGEYIYKKSSLVLDDYVNDFNNESDVDKRIAKGNLVLEAMDKVIKLGEGDTKDLNKQLKKIDDKAQIKSLLGL